MGSHPLGASRWAGLHYCLQHRRQWNVEKACINCNVSGQYDSTFNLVQYTIYTNSFFYLVSYGPKPSHTLNTKMVHEASLNGSFITQLPRQWYIVEPYVCELIFLSLPSYMNKWWHIPICNNNIVNNISLMIEIII